MSLPTGSQTKSRGFVRGVLHSLGKSLRLGSSRGRDARASTHTKSSLPSCPEDQESQVNLQGQPSGASSLPSYNVRKTRSEMRPPSASSHSSASSIERGDSAYSEIPVSQTLPGAPICPVAMATRRINHDLDVLSKAMAKMNKQVQGTYPLAEWQVHNLKTRFNVMHKLAQDLHCHEEGKLFPLMKQEHSKICDTLKCQNTEIIMLWSSLRSKVCSLMLSYEASADLEALRPIMNDFARLHVAFKAHRVELETKLLPLLQKQCTEKELRACDSTLLRDPSHQDWAHFLSLQHDEKVKKAVMQYMGAGRLTQTMVLMHACKQYSSKVGPMFSDLSEGNQGAGRGKSTISARSSSSDIFAGGIGVAI